MNESTDRGRARKIMPTIDQCGTGTGDRLPASVHVHQAASSICMNVLGWRDRFGLEAEKRCGVDRASNHDQWKNLQNFRFLPHAYTDPSSLLLPGK